MNKRIRKKKRVKEFYEPFLIIKGSFQKELTDKEVDDFIDRVCEMSDTLKTCFGGCTTNSDFDYHFSGYRYYRDRMTLEKRDKIYEYLMFLKTDDNDYYVKEVTEMKYIQNEKEEKEDFNI